MPNYVNLNGLTQYDIDIKNYIAGEDAKSYKTILISQDGKTIYFYKKDNATLSDTADFSIRLGGMLSESYVPSFSGDALCFNIGTVTS